MLYVQRTAKPDGTVPAISGTDPQLLELCPGLHEWLTASRWDDGKARLTGTAMVLCEGGYWKAWLHDRDGKRSAWVTASSLLDLLIAADAMISSGAGDWRPDRK